MTPAQVRRIALALPEAREAPHFESASFRIGTKIFATLPPGGAHLHVFVDETDRDRAMALHPAWIETLRWGKRVAGLRVALATADTRTVEHLLARAWARKAPKRLSSRSPT